MNFFYSFTETALHSLWQSALMLMTYTAVNGFVKRMHPLQKRNFLYFLLLTQILVSAFTFIYYFTGSSLNHLVSITEVLNLNSSVFPLLLPYADTLFYIYALIVSYRFYSVWQQCAIFRNQCSKQLIKPSAEVKVFTVLKAYQLGIKRKVTLRYSNFIKVPFTYGFFKPFILLPLSLVNNLTIQETESIILHELAHIKSRDYLFNWLLIITDILYFFNPFIKIITANIKAEREKNCDVQVINFNYDHLGYAETLLKIARLSKSVKDFQLAAVRKTPELLQRISFFSEKKNLVFSKTNNVLPSIFVFILVSFFFFLFIPIKKDQKQVLSFVRFPVSKENKLPVIMNREIKSETHLKIYAAIKHTRIKKSAQITAVAQSPEDQNNNVNLNVIPVAFNETPDSTKEFIYKEETQRGKITQSFKLTLINGEWIMQPQWMMLETKPDSIFIAAKDSIQ